jgi:hypothetical protein
MNDNLPMRELLTRVPTTAIEIAALVPLLPIQTAADLIQQYADTVAAGARIDATQEAYERMERRMRLAIETPLAAEPTEYEATLKNVAEEMAK